VHPTSFPTAVRDQAAPGTKGEPCAVPSEERRRPATSDRQIGTSPANHSHRDAGRNASTHEAERKTGAGSKGKGYRLCTDPQRSEGKVDDDQNRSRKAHDSLDPTGSTDVPCKYHNRGNCRHGAQCLFRHDDPGKLASSQHELKPVNRPTTKVSTYTEDPVGGGDAPATPAVHEIFGQQCTAAAHFKRHQCGVMLEGSSHGPIRWLADTGCAADLIGLNDMTPGDLDRIESTPVPICFSSANGPVWATSTLPLQGTALLAEMNPYVMEQTPAVLSIGRRCM
jgi:hypothetical protein